MPCVRLPVISNATPTIGGAAEQLAVFLLPVDDPVIQGRIGVETIVKTHGQHIATQGERFPMRDGWVQGLRYLTTNDEGAIVAALNVSLRKTGRTLEAVASNVYVHPKHRRLGMASVLMWQALEDYPQLCADSAMSEAGAALVGQSTQTARKLRP